MAMSVADVLAAVVDLISDLGLVVFIAAGAVIAAAATLFRRVRR